MSSPNHLTSNIKDAFSSNFPDYPLASPNYFPTTPRNTSPNSSNDFTKYLSDILVFSPLHDDPNMEVIQACDAIDKELHVPSLQTIIALPAVLPPSLVLSPSPMFDSQDFFPPEEISLPKDTETSPSSSLDNSLWITPHLLGEKPVPEEPNEMPPKRRSTSTALASEAPTMTQAAIRQLIVDGISAALEAQATNMENTDNTNRNSGPRETPVTRKYTYKEFMSCQPFYFNGTE
ncbi:hypothetical protein Tco_1365515 [Tanacetum coccineum]